MQLSQDATLLPGADKWDYCFYSDLKVFTGPDQTGVDRPSSCRSVPVQRRFHKSVGEGRAEEGIGRGQTQ